MRRGRNQAVRAAFANRQEIINARLTRRDLMRLGLLTSTGYLIAKQGLSARASDGTIASPPTTPFIAPLPVQKPISPVVLDPAPACDPIAGEAPRAAHQAWYRCPPKRYYEIRQTVGTHSFHPHLAPSQVFLQNGTLPGPLIHGRYGEPALVRFRNDLPPNHVGFGVPQVSMHLHNSHTPSESDGYPGDFYNSGFFKDHHFPHVCAGGDYREALGTLWYHDHRFDFTSQNVYRGLAGFYLMFDELDSGDEWIPTRTRCGCRVASTTFR